MGAKLGFVPWAIDDVPFTDLPTMIIGIDTYGKLNVGNESIMAIVATTDCNFA